MSAGNLALYVQDTEDVPEASRVEADSDGDVVMCATSKKNMLDVLCDLVLELCEGD